MTLRDRILKENNLSIIKPTVDHSLYINKEVSLLKKMVEQIHNTPLLVLLNLPNTRQMSIRQLARYLSRGKVIVSKSTVANWIKEYRK